MSVRIYIPSDTTARSLGAEQLAAAVQTEAIQRQLDVTVIRNGTRGLYWLEPLVEVEDAAGERQGYGPVTIADVKSLFDQGFHHASTAHPLSLGPVETIPYLEKQQRLTFSRIGIIEPLSLQDYIDHEGYQGLTKALAVSPQNIVDEVKTSGLRGRGGAAFPTGIKWQTVLDTPAEQKYIVCNADEGDSGTFADRLVMECDPFMLIEGMTIAGLAVGATQGYIYLRSEYPLAEETLNAAIAQAYEHGYLGDNLRDSGKRFDLEVRLGAGAYICGEETSLLDSLEGKRGLVRAKPPLPAIIGLFGQPTVVNNVLSLAAIPYILDQGGQAYADYGVGRSRGTLPIQLAGNVKQGGLVELAFGIELNELIEQFGGGTLSGRPLKAVQVGGPLGAYLPASQWHTRIDYEDFTAEEAVLGHGGVVLFDETIDMGEQARFAMEFCQVESCGKCTPCRIGSTRGVEVIDRIRQQQNPEKNWQLLEDLCDTLEKGSLCAMGGMTPIPVMSVMKHFPDELRTVREE